MEQEILIIRLSSIGDILHCTPVVSSLKAAWPKCRITWLVGEAAAELIKYNPYIDEIIIWSRENFEKQLRKFALIRTYDSWRDLQKKLASKNFDMLLDIHGLFLTGVIASQVRTTRRIGMSEAREFNSLFMTEVAEPLSRHIVDRYLGVLKPLEIRPLQDKMTLVIPEDSRDFAKTFLTAAGVLLSDRFVVLVPGTTWASKNWPTELFAKVACSIHQDFKIVLCGGKLEVKLGREIQTKAGVVLINAIARTSVLELAAILERAAVVVSGDTGPLHMAAALGVPTVGLFGPTDPEIYAPRGQQHATLFHKLACSFCHKVTCPLGHGRCMLSVTPEEVVQQVHSLVLDRGASPS
jgi:lipopolysaccharide heptosyltransferase I